MHLPTKLEGLQDQFVPIFLRLIVKEGMKKHFIGKLTDADAENSETQVWLQFAVASKYISEKENQALIKESEEVGKLIQYMIDNPGKFGV